MFSHWEATHQSNSFSTILDRIFKARNASRYGKISGSSLTFLPSKRCIAAWILSSKNCSISGYALLLSMPFAITTPKQALGSSSKISFLTTQRKMAMRTPQKHYPQTVFRKIFAYHMTIRTHNTDSLSKNGGKCRIHMKSCYQKHITNNIYNAGNKYKYLYTIFIFTLTLCPNT